MKKYLLLCLLATVCIAPISAQRVKSGVSFSYLHPLDKFGDAFTGGLGLHVNVEAKIISRLSLTAQVGYKSFAGEENVEDVSAIDAELGIKLRVFTVLYAEVRSGYLFNDIDESVLIPAIGARFRRIDVNVGYQVLDDIQYVEARICLFILGGDHDDGND